MPRKEWLGIRILLWWLVQAAAGPTGARFWRVSLIGSGGESDPVNTLCYRYYLQDYGGTPKLVTSLKILATVGAVNVMRIFGSAVRCPKRDHDCYHPAEQSSPLRDMLYCSAVLFAGEAGSILDSKPAGARLPEWMNTHAGTMTMRIQLRQYDNIV